MTSKAGKVGRLIWAGMVIAGGFICASQGFRGGAWLLISGIIFYLDSSMGACLYDEPITSASSTTPGHINTCSTDLGLNQQAEAH